MKIVEMLHISTHGNIFIILCYMYSKPKFNQVGNNMRIEWLKLSSKAHDFFGLVRRVSGTLVSNPSSRRQCLFSFVVIYQPVSVFTHISHTSSVALVPVRICHPSVLSNT